MSAVAKVFAAPPNLLPLFVRAVATSRLHGGDSVDPRVYELAEREIDGDDLAAYQRVCGFGVSDVLPPTYLHVLAFPLAVARMVETDFPFPLVGLVHVHNSITQRRPVRLGERVTLRVRADGVRPHPAGTQVEILAEAFAGDEPVWTGISSYLRRGKQSGDGRQTGDGGEKAAPRPVATRMALPASVVRVPADIGRRYAAVAGDHNPIHLHSLSARAFGFPSAIAHGMWLKARTLAALQGRLPESYTVDVAFKTPVLLPSAIELALTGSARDGWSLDVHQAQTGKPHLIGTVSPS